MEPAEAFGDSTGFLLHRLGVGVDRLIGRTLEPLGLRARDLRVLGFIGAGGHSQRELAAMTGLDRTTMVAVVDRLEALGLVERAVNDADRRKQTVGVTAAGRAARAEAVDLLGRAEAAFLDPLPEADRETLNRLLRDLFRHRRPDC